MRAVIALIFLCHSWSYSQQDSIKTAPGPWAHTIVTGLTLTQVAFRDWNQGGENALSYTVGLYGQSMYTEEMMDWSSSYKFAFGQTRLSVQGLKKTDDKIDLESVVTFKPGTFLNLYGAVTLKSQFATGYRYDEATGGRTPVSKFFDPAYLTQSTGIGYRPLSEIKTRLGVALREIVTSVYVQYADDPATSAIEKTSVKGGFESVTNVEWKLDQNILFTAKLELFAAFDKLNQVIMRSDNSLAAKVNKYISVIINVQLINERNISPRTQVKQTLGLGLSYQLL